MGQPLGRFSCPDSRYVLQTVSPQSLESGHSGECVYRYQPNVPWMENWPAQAEHVSGPMCPPSDYRVAPSGPCTGSVIPGSQIDGFCPKVCQDGSGNYFDCSYTVPVNQSVPTPTQSYDPSGPNVSCTFVYPAQPACDDGRPSGASYRGQVSWGGRCVLTASERIPAGG